jgi:methionine sulfoxide reductase heme-binding subunit
MSTRLLKGRGPDLKTAQEVLSLATIVAIAVHGLVLIGDEFLHPSLADVTIPFVSACKTVWTTLGIISGWALVLLALSFYVRKYIGVQRWRAPHCFTALAWIVGVVHSLGEGTDAGHVWFLVMTGVVAMPAALLLVTRLAPARSRLA